MQTTLALWVSVPMTLYTWRKAVMAVPLQVLVRMGGFQYTWKDKELSANCVTRVSRNGMAPFS